MFHKKKKPGKQKLVGQKADLLFFHPTKECLQFLYVTVIEVLQSVKNVDTVGFIPGTGKTCTVLYYVRAEIELSDLYLRANLGGNAVTEVKTADNVMNEEWLALA